MSYTGAFRLALITINDKMASNYYKKLSRTTTIHTMGYDTGGARVAQVREEVVKI